MKLAFYAWYILRSLILRGPVAAIRFTLEEITGERSLGLKTGGTNNSGNRKEFRYQGAPYYSLRKILPVVFKMTGNLPFIDIGSGKGRAVFVAEQFGYRQLKGIERNKELVRIAQENLSSYSPADIQSTISFECADALNYDYPGGSSVYFLFNPFDGEILEKVLDSVLKSGNRTNWFVYMNPEHRDVFERRKIPAVKVIRTNLYVEAIVYRVG